MQLQPNFHFLEVAYPYVARRLLTDEDPALRERLFQVFILHHALVSVLTFHFSRYAANIPAINRPGCSGCVMMSKYSLSTSTER